MPGSDLIPQTWSHLGEFSSHFYLPSHGFYLVIFTLRTHLKETNSPLPKKSHIGAELSLQIIHSGTVKWKCLLIKTRPQIARTQHGILSRILGHPRGGPIFPDFFVPCKNREPCKNWMWPKCTIKKCSVFLIFGPTRKNCKGPYPIANHSPRKQNAVSHWDKLPRRLKWHAWHCGTLVSSALYWAKVKSQRMTFHKGFLRGSW